MVELNYTFQYYIKLLIITLNFNNMKSKIFKSAILIFIMLTKLNLIAQTFTCEPGPLVPVCTPVGDPFYDFTCFASIEKYLARSIAMDGLAEQNSQTGDPVCDNNNACNLQYNECPHGGHCPQRYCEDIQILTQINAQFIRRAAGVWGDEWRFAPPHTLWNTYTQTVIDINRAYDCANLRRPIIQAALLEHVTTDVRWITIPQIVKNAFLTDPDYIAQSAFYSGNVNFRRNNIVYNPNDSSSHTPNLNRIEARMWFYYLGINYIDRGYKGLHIGQLQLMASNDVGYAKTFDLLSKLRNYASSLPASTFVLIDAHVYNDIYLNNTNQLLLDFNSSPLRAEEVTTLDGSPCDIAGSIQYATSPVRLNARLKNDPTCGLIGNSTGGISPLGCYYPYTPYFLEIDHFGHPQTGGVLSVSTNCEHIWGTDEENWFFNIQSDQCRDHIINKFYRQVREFQYKGFFQPMGSKGISVQHQNYMDFYAWKKERYRLFDHPTTITSIANLWKTNPLTNTMNGTKRCLAATGLCFSPLSIRRINRYDFSVPNPDNSSVYTFHIQNPFGAWLPFSYGNSRVLYPPMTGVYTIYIRQDNIGLPNNLNTVKQISFKVFLYKYCCGELNQKRIGDENYEGDTLVFDENEDFTAFNEYLHNGEFTEYNADMQFEDSLQAVTEVGEKPLGDNLYTLENNQFEVKLYPNPSNGIFNINLISSKNQTVEIKLKNMLGQTIKVLDNNVKLQSNLDYNKIYNISTISKSVYFIEISEESGKKHNLKFVLE